MKTVKIFGKSIPAVLLIAIAIVGLVSASYPVWSHNFTTTVNEPIIVKVTNELTNPMYPGSYDTLQYDIHNEGPNKLSITVTWPPGSAADEIIIYASARYIDAEGNLLDTITSADYDGTETFTLDAVSYARVSIFVQVSDDAAPQTVKVPVTVSRG